LSILVVGAIHHDVIVEAPAIPRLDETLQGRDVRYAFGGKGGNQAVAAGRLGKERGIPVAMAACIGSDAPGRNALDVLANAGVSIEQVQQVDGPTGMSVAISLPDGGYGAVIVSASNLALDGARVALPEDLGWLVLQNELPEAINTMIAKRAKRAGARVLLNSAPARSIDDACLPLADVLVVNRVEALDLTGLEGGDLSVEQTAAWLSNRFDCSVVLTLGGDGVVVADAKGLVLPGHTVGIVSTHGAGDAFVGALAVHLAGGATLVEAVRLANAAAALHVSTPVDQRHTISHAMIEALAQTFRR
jgi:ribokinase